jgi:hypothetical protein
VLGRIGGAAIVEDSVRDVPDPRAWNCIGPNVQRSVHLPTARLSHPPMSTELSYSNYVR